MPTVNEKAADDLQEWQRTAEKIHQMGHSVERKRIPFFEKRDWEAEDVMDVWAGKYTRNIALHYKDILKDGDIRGLYGILGGRPVAVVGAGPSLDNNVECLRDFPGIIIACDGAAIPLTARGINPDIVVAVDPRLSVISDMLDYDENQNQILALSVCVDPKIAEVWRGKRLYFCTIHEGTQFHDRVLPELFPGMPGLQATGNVGNTAVQLAHGMGAGKVVLVGQDYGYTGGRMRCDSWECSGAFKHVPTSPSGFSWIRIPKGPKDHEDALALRSGKETVDGVLTYGAFKGYRDSLYQIIKVMKIDAVNATEGGILVGMPREKLFEVVQNLKAQNHDASVARDLLAKATGGKPCLCKQ